MNTSKLVKRYTDYRVKNAQIKARQKVEREKELQPFLADIGEAVSQLRAEGMSVVDQAIEVTNKNRNFLYNALRAFDARQIPTPVEEVTPQGWVEPKYTVTANGTDVYTVEFYVDGHESDYRDEVDLYLSDGVVDDFPDAWSTGTPEERAFYKRLIAEVEAAASATTA